MLTREILYFALLALLVNLSVVGLHAVRERITLGPLFALAGALTLLLWQFLQLGWWITWGVLHLNAAVLAIVPALVAGAALCYALDGLRTARAYLVVVAASALVAFGAAVFREGLARFVPLPYAISYAPIAHLALAAAIVGGGVVAVVAFELSRRASLLAALPLGIFAGVGAAAAARAFVEYGWSVGAVSFAGEGPELVLASGLTVLIAFPHWASSVRRRGTVPARSLRELLSFWKRAESSLREAREDIVNAQRTISELRKLNTELAESERLRDYQMMNSPFGMLYTDPAGRIVKANRAAGDLLGREPAALAGQDLAAALAARGIAALRLDALAASSAERLVQVAGDGDEARSYELQATLLADYRQRPAGYSVLVKDVTERERAARRRLIGERVRGVHETGRVITHDISNLIIGTQSHLHSLEAALADANVREAGRALGLANRALAHGREMLNQLGAGQVFARPDLRAVDLARLIAEAIEVCEPGARKKRVKLQYAQGGVPYFIEADATQIVRVLTNLINNAARASPAAGKVKIEVAPDAAGVTVSVSDRGEGMSEAQIARAFDPGYSTKESGQGGLGLAITYLIVDAHGGSIRLERRRRGGLAAHVWLPAAPAPAEAVDLGGARFAVWLANLDSSAAVASRLEAAGAEVAEVQSAEELATFATSGEGACRVLTDRAEAEQQAAGQGLACLRLDAAQGNAQGDAQALAARALELARSLG